MAMSHISFAHGIEAYLLFGIYLFDISKYFHNEIRSFAFYYSVASKIRKVFTKYVNI